MDPTTLPPEQLAQIPAGTPPPGIVPNFTNPPSDGYKFLSVGAVFSAVMLIFASLRFYVKVFVVRRITLDDYTLLLGVICTIAYYSATCYEVVADGIGRHAWDVSLATVLSDHYSISALVQVLISYLAWAFIKVSFLIFYLHIFRPFTWLRYSIYTVIGILVGFYFSLFISSVVLNVPFAGQTWQEVFTTPRHAMVFAMTLPVGIGGLVLDIAILVLPMLGTARLQLTRSRKLGVMCVFLIGLLACICSSVSLYYKYLLTLPAGLNDYSIVAVPLFITSLLEMCIGSSAACMLSIAQFKTKRRLSWSKLGKNSIVLSMKSLLGSKNEKTIQSENSSEHMVSNQGTMVYGQVDTQITVDRSSPHTKEDRHEMWEV